MPGKYIAQLGIGLVNNALSQENAETHRQWQEQMWHMQNKYNHPAAMADRMRAAGLNPYMQEGAIPAGSVGNGAVADTFPLADPLESMVKFAEYTNLNADSHLKLNTADKVFEEANRLRIALQMDLISKEEYNLKFNKLKEAFEKYNPFEIEYENQIADTDLKKSQKTTEDDLREPRKNLLEKEADEAEASALLKGKEANIKEFEEKYADEYFEERNKNLKYDTKLKESQKLANYAQEVASYALADKYEAEVDHLKTIDLKMWSEEQRAAALHPFEMIIRQECAEQGKSESETAKYIAQFNEIVLRPGFKFSDIPTLLKKWIMDNTAFSSSVSLSFTNKG